MFRDPRRHETGNRLIDSLPNDVAKRLSCLEESKKVTPGEIIYRHNGPVSHVYFPVSTVCSQVVTLENGRRIAAATVGNEGMLGEQVVLGLDFSPTMVISLIPGRALRVAVPAFLETLGHSEYLSGLLRRYAAYCLRCAHQSVACNTTHSVEERMSRWLLMTHDRMGQDKFPLTQQVLAEMLGVRRQTVTLVAQTLQAAGYITYRRGIVQVVNRQGLETVGCECYEVDRTAYQAIVTK